MNSSPWLRAKDGLISGLSLGLSRKLDIDVFWIRLFWVVTVFLGGTGLILYLVLSLCLPSEEQAYKNERKMLLGVCLLLAQKMDWDTGLTRFAYLWLATLSLGLAVLVYLLIYLFKPKGVSGVRGQPSHQVIDL